MILTRVLLAVAGLAGSLAAETVELPAEFPLNAASVVLELHHADVHVLLDPSAAPVLVARSAGGTPTPGGLDRDASHGILEIRRPPGEDVRLKIDVVVGAEQEVHLEGRELSVVTRESRQLGVTAPRGLHLVLERSQLDVEGGRDAVVEARETSLRLTRTRGLLQLALASGDAEVEAHEGDVKLEAEGTEVTLADTAGGRVDLLLGGGRLDLRGGSGRFTAKATDAVVLVADWRGPFALTGAGTRVEARGVQGGWKLEGEDLQVTLEEMAGAIDVRLGGGGLRAETMDKRMAVTATNRADVELTDLTQGVKLELSAGATARLTGISGDLEATVDDAFLRADGVERLSLDGARSEVFVGEIGQLTRLEMSDSELDLALAADAGDASVKLLGTGRATLRLPAPCRVRIEGPEGTLASDRADITGCELRVPGQPLSSARERLIYGERPPLTLTVTLEDGVDLTVEGEP